MELESITIAGELASLKQLSLYIRAVSQQVGLTKNVAYKLNLAVDEIVTNIINHGYTQSATKGEIVIESCLEGDKLNITVADTANPFNPLTDAKEPDTTVPFDERPIGGWGIFFAKENVDQFLYKYQDGHNYNIFVVQIGQ